MLLERLEKMAAIIGVPVAIFALIVSYLQLKSANMDSLNSRTIQVAMEYLTSDVINDAKIVINKNTKEGTDYSAMRDNSELQRSVRLILNYLETVSTGVENGVYDEKIICSHLRRIIEKQVSVHIRGQLTDGVVAANPTPFSENDYKSLMHMYLNWRDNKVCLL